MGNGSPARKLMAANVRTSLGNISLVVDRVPAESQRPVVLMLHGLLREAGNLTGWYDIIPPSLDLVIADLPGHGRSPGEGAATVEAMAQRLRETLTQHFVGRPVVVVGESVGGLVALALGDGALAQIRGVIAADPPFSTCKQWPVCAHLMTKYRDLPQSDYRRTLFSDLLGYDGGDGMREKLYYDLVRKVRVPALILSGGIPLWPQWHVLDFTQAIPSLVDDVDRYVISLIGNRHVTLETVSSKGHVLFDQPEAAMQKRISDFCLAAVLPTASAHDIARPAPAYSDTLLWR